MAYEEPDLGAVVLERALGCRDHLQTPPLVFAVVVSEVESPWLVRCVYTRMQGGSEKGDKELEKRESKGRK